MAAFKDRRSECDTKTNDELLWKLSGFVSRARAYAARGHARLQHPFNLSYKGIAREKEGRSSIFVLEQSLSTGTDRKRYVSFTTLSARVRTRATRYTVLLFRLRDREA